MPDVVTLNHVLEHVERPVALLQAIKKRLKPDGVIFVEVPNCDSYLLRAADAYFRLRGLDWSTRLSPLHPPFHKFGFTAASLRHALTASEFDMLLLTTFSGRDRGYNGKVTSFATRLRGAASSALSLLGNRELLVAIARPHQ
jgi:SAM-dependent methyltransferase